MIITWFFLNKYDAPIYNLGVAYYTVIVKCPMWFRKWPNTLSSDMMAKELDFWNCKLALLLIDNQSSCPEAAENFLHIFLMLLHGLAGHIDVI